MKLGSNVMMSDSLELKKKTVPKELHSKYLMLEICSTATARAH